MTAQRAPIVADGTLMRRGYYTRKQQYEHLGAQFLDREYIRRRNPFRTTDIFRDLPGLRVNPGRERSYTVSMRGNCEPAVFIDGTYVNRFQVQREERAPRSIRPSRSGGGAGTGGISPDDVRERQLREGETTSIDLLVAPSSIAAIEVYQMNQVPAEYMNFSSTPCGVIVIWTGGETA